MGEPQYDCSDMEAAYHAEQQWDEVRTLRNQLSESRTVERATDALLAQLRADLARSRRRERQLRRAVLAHAGMRCYGRMVDARIQRDYARESGGAIAESVAAHWDERAKQQDRIGDELMRRARDAASDGKEKP